MNLLQPNEIQFNSPIKNTGSINAIEDIKKAEEWTTRRCL